MYSLDIHTSWSALPLLRPLLVSTSPRPFCLGLFIYVFTLHQPTLQPSAAARPTCGSGSRICKTSYRCPLYVTFPLLLEPALSLLGAGHLITFSADQPVRVSPKAHRPLSLLLGMRDIHSYPQARYSIPRLFSLPNCDLSIAAV